MLACAAVLSTRVCVDCVAASVRQAPYCIDFSPSQLPMAITLTRVTLTSKIVRTIARIERAPDESINSLCPFVLRLFRLKWIIDHQFITRFAIGVFSTKK